MELSRRSLFKTTGAGLLVAALPPLVVPELVVAEVSSDASGVRLELAERISHRIYTTVTNEANLPVGFYYERGQATTRFTLSETRGRRVAWLAKGGYVESSVIHSDVVEIPSGHNADVIGTHIMEYEDKIEQDPERAVVEIAKACSDELLDQIDRRLSALREVDGLHGIRTAKAVFFGGVRAKSFTEEDNWYWHYICRMFIGAMVIS